MKIEECFTAAYKKGWKLSFSPGKKIHPNPAVGNTFFFAWYTSVSDDYNGHIGNIAQMTL